MAEGNGNGLAAYQALDEKIEGVEHRFEAKLDRFENKFNENFQNFQSNVMAQIRASGGSKGNGGQVIPLLSLGLGIVILFGSVLTFIYSDLSASIKRTDDLLKDSIQKVTDAHDKEQALRADAERRIYDSIVRLSDNSWPKVAQVEFARREDEIRDLQYSVAKDAIATLTGGLKDLARDVVPKAQLDMQYNALQESLNRIAGRVAQAEDRNATKFDSLERETHPYGTADVFKDLGSRVQDIQDKLFRLLVPSPPLTTPTGPPAAKE